MIAWEPGQATVVARRAAGATTTTLVRPSKRAGIPDAVLAVHEDDTCDLVVRQTPRAVWRTSAPWFDLEALWLAGTWTPPPGALRVDWAANDHAQVAGCTWVAWPVVVAFANDARHHEVLRGRTRLRLPWSVLEGIADSPDDPGIQLGLL